MFRVHGRGGIHIRRAGLIDEDIGQHHGAIFEALIEHALLRQQLRHMAAETTDRAFLDGDQCIVVCGQIKDQVTVQRLGEPRVGDGGGDPLGGKVLGCFFDLGEARAKAKQSNRFALADHAPLADLKRGAPFRHVHAGPFATRKAEGDGAVIMGGSGGDHMSQLRLVGGGHDGEARQVREVGHVERARMCRTVRAHKTRTVNGKAHRQTLDRHVMHNLIIATLQKGRVHRAKRFHPTRSESRREGHAMLLGNAHVKTAAGIPLGKEIETGAIGHGRRHRANLVVVLRLLDQMLGKNLGVAGRVGGCLLLLTCHHVELGRRVALVAGGFSRGVAFALFGQHMDQDRAGRAILDSAQDGQQLRHVVPVDGAEIAEPQFLKQRPTHSHALEHFLSPLRALPEGFGQQAYSALGGGLEILERVLGIEPRQIGRHRAHGWGNRHLVVVQNNDQTLAQMARVVQRLIGHTSTHRSVTDDGDGVAQSFGDHAAQIAGHGKAECRTNRGRGVRCAKWIVGGFGALGETA
mmetsp:Transcript_24080/g.44518  ORF Transcript_24080/g.44518 Transcript_24080/m.44518 type:complete len:521 (-) Transcript_24080:5233-6795(-)